MSTELSKRHKEMITSAPMNTTTVLYLGHNKQNKISSLYLSLSLHKLQVDHYTFLGGIVYNHPM